VRAKIVWGLEEAPRTGALVGELEAMTRAWPAEYSASGVRVSAVAPGPVYTPTSSGLDRHDAVWARAHDDPDHVNHDQGAGHV
jgi:NAD(P)-dependent dehydrogenase (short-subunit alcohol dehydrogenase family)